MSPSNYSFIDVPSTTSLLDFVSKMGADKPLQRIVQLAEMHGVKTVLQEKNINNEQWDWEYREFYSKMFKPYGSSCDCFHFFSKRIKSITEIPSAASDYVGYCVLRPLRAQRVIEAIIKPLPDKNTPKKSFNLCSVKKEIEIAKEKLEIEGFPFMQQDTQYGCCASVSLWMVGQYMASAFGSEAHSIGTILESVNKIRHLERPLPTSGLQPIHISVALQEMGLSPIVYDFRKGVEPHFSAQRIIYHYIESKIPVIVLIPTALGVGHSLVVIGHTFDPDTWWALAKRPYYDRSPSGYAYHSSTTWIPQFVVQDDNFGPYLTVPKEYMWEMAAKRYLIVVVGLPQEVILKGEEAEVYVYNFLNDDIIIENLEEASKRIDRWPEMFLQYLNKGELVLRTFLIRSEAFKNDLKTRFAGNPEVMKLYTTIDMPEFVWKTEISVPEIFCHQRMRLGEVIVDSTAILSLGEAGFLGVHLPGWFISRNPVTEKIDRYKISDYEPYEHLIR